MSRKDCHSKEWQVLQSADFAERKDGRWEQIMCIVGERWEVVGGWEVWEVHLCHYIYIYEVSKSSTEYYCFSCWCISLRQGSNAKYTFIYMWAHTPHVRDTVRFPQGAGSGTTGNQQKKILSQCRNEQMLSINSKIWNEWWHEEAVLNIYIYLYL